MHVCILCLASPFFFFFLSKPFLWVFIFAVQSFSHIQLFATPWTARHQASLSFTISQSLLRLMSIGSTMPIQSSHSVACWSSCLQSFPALGSFLMSRFFTSGGQNNGTSTSAPVLPMNIQGWFPLGLTGFISLLSKGLSRVFSSTTIQKHQLFGSQPSLWSNSLTIQTFVSKVMSLLFNRLSRLVIAFFPTEQASFLILWLQSLSWSPRK